MYETDVTVSSKDALADPPHVGADPDPTFHFDAGPDPTVYFDANPDPNPDTYQSETNLPTGLQTLHGSIWSLNVSSVNVYGTSMAPFFASTSTELRLKSGA
jgi:hypothetical protein